MSSSFSQNIAQQYAANLVAQVIRSLSRPEGSSSDALPAGNATPGPTFGTDGSSAHAQTSQSEAAMGNSSNAAVSASKLGPVRVMDGIQPAGNFPQILK
jgi:hypothetical protein